MPTFQEIKENCMRHRTLWEDPDFPASGESINLYDSDPSNQRWMRPRAITKRPPKFIVLGATRFDLAQGGLGDCWFIASAAVLATKPELFRQVVPTEQNFISEYIGAFRFNIWRFGNWVEVIVDDRLPVDEDGELRFAHNRGQPNEFWVPLLEKAYAKLHSSYRMISSGHIRDALVDLTGGLSECFNLRREDDLPEDLFEIVQQSYNVGSMMGASIRNDTGETQEEKVWNGLYKGHAYSITAVMQQRIQGWSVKLIRLRNPWGKSEWTGPWSDESDEWKSIPAVARKKMELVVEDDGEFWMDFAEVLKNFTLLDIVHLGPHSYVARDAPKDKLKWHMVQYEGEWVKGVNAGGCGLVSPKKLYYTNPQYFVTLRKPDRDVLNITRECTMVVSLLQKDYRKRWFTPALKRLMVGFDIHHIKGGRPKAMDSVTFQEKTKLKKQFRTRTVLREVTCRIFLDPGDYVIIPSTLREDQEAEFLLRIFTFSPAESQEIKEETGPVIQEDDSEQNKPVGVLSSEMFSQYAGSDNIIDARDLRDILNQLSKKEFGETTAFSVEACRTLLAMKDESMSGELDFDQTATVWDEILFWRRMFQKHDKDKSGGIETWELRKIVLSLGLTLSYTTLKTLSVRYGGKDRTLFFEDFILCLAKTLTMFRLFKKYSEKTAGEARLSLEEWMQMTLYY